MGTGIAYVETEAIPGRTVNHRHAKRRRISDTESSRASGSDAATVLFRHTEASTKKHTRPPISKLFSSIGLQPEQFLELSADAKNYMLDESHPERRDTVGVRGKSDSELVKLKLWNCVHGFVETEGYGEKYFGAHASGSGSMVWPQDKSKIVKALFPLLRRVITNEKQRQYALESRSKGPLPDNDNSNSNNTEEIPKPMDLSKRIKICKWNPTDYKVGTLFNEFTQQDLASYQSWKEYRQAAKIVQLFNDTGISEPGFDEIIAIMDFHLRSFHSAPNSELVMCSKPCENSIINGIVDSYPEIWEYGHWRSDLDINPCDKSINVRVLLHELYQSLRILTGHSLESESTYSNHISTDINSHASSNEHTPVSVSPHPSGTTTMTHEARECSEASRSALTLRISILPHDQDTVLDKREMLAADTPYLHSLLQRLCQSHARNVSRQAKVSVLLPNGLTLTEDDAAWVAALKTARQTLWFDGVVSVVVRVPT